MEGLRLHSKSIKGKGAVNKEKQIGLHPSKIMTGSKIG